MRIVQALVVYVLLCLSMFHARGEVTCLTGVASAGAVADYEQGSYVVQAGNPPQQGCGVLFRTAPLWAHREGIGGLPGGHTYPIWTTVSGAASASFSGLGSPNITTLRFTGSANARIESLMVGLGLFGSIQVVMVDVAAASSGGCTLNLTKRTVVRISGSPAAVSGRTLPGGVGSFVAEPGTLSISFGGVATFSFPEFTLDGVLTRPADVAKSFSTVVTFEEDPPPVALRAIEVTQSIQDWHNSVILISNKTTFARAFLEAVNSADAGRRVHGVLRGFRAGNELPESPLQPFTGTTIQPLPGFGAVAAFSDRALLPNSAADARPLDGANVGVSLNFRLPESWTRERVDLKLETTAAELEYREPPDVTAGGTLGGDGIVRVNFAAGARPKVLVAPIKIRRSNGSHTPGPPLFEMMQVLIRTGQMYPVDKIDFEIREPLVSNQRFGISSAHLLSLVQQWRAQDTRDGVVYAGLASAADLPSGMAEEGETGILGEPIVWAASNNPRNFAHELGHVLGLEHPVDAAGNGMCGSFAPANTPAFPFLFPIAQPDGTSPIRATLGPMDQGEDRAIYGWEWRAGSYMPLVPTKNFELMGYCESLWPSSHNYEELRVRINNRWGSSSSPAAPSPAGLPELQQGNATREYLLVRGILDLNAGTVEWLPFKRATRTTTAQAPTPGPFALRMKDVGGLVIQEIPFTLNLPVSGIGGTAFLLPVEADPNIRQVDLLQGGNLVGTIAASANAPAVEIVAPNGGEVLNAVEVDLRWTASDADGDELSYTVLYSPDNGGSWRPLAIDYSETNLVIATADLTGGAQALLRVLASDGFHCVGDQSDAAFAVMNRGPITQILEPLDGAEFEVTEPIVLEAISVDREDGIVENHRYAWYTEHTGEFAFANEPRFYFRPRALPPGEHVITLKVTDSAGATTAVTNRIKVREFRAARLALQDGGAILNISGPPMTRTVVEVSSNLVNWAVWGSRDHEASGEATIPVNALQPALFFRARTEALLPPAPIIVDFPTATNVIAGRELVLFGNTTGAGLSFQWYHDGNVLPIQTNATLRFTNVGGVRNGNYFLVVSNAGGAVTSSVAVVTVLTERYDRLHSFGDATNGLNGWGPLIFGSDGWLYGCARNGGISNAGVVYKMEMTGSNYTVLHRFVIASEGSMPLGGVIEGSDGFLFGTTSLGGSGGAGTIFKLGKDGTGFTVLRQFASTGDCRNPQSELLEGSDGALYGTANQGGGNGRGGVFKINKDGSGYTIINGFLFGGAGFPRQPVGGLIEGLDGLLYGATEFGGISNNGAVFRMGKDGTSPFIVASLGVVEGGAANCVSTLLRASDGLLYGTAYSGGPSNVGAVFKVSTNGSFFSVLAGFGTNDVAGVEPRAPLTEAANGDLVGTTRVGGAANQGVIFRLSRFGAKFETLRSFSETNIPGARSRSPLLRAPDGAFFGTTFAGGAADQGIIFRYFVPELAP